MWCIFILSLCSFLEVAYTLKLHPSDVNITAMAIRLNSVEASLAQEKILRQDLEKKLDNTSVALQQERIKNLEQKLENTTQLLNSVDVSLAHEKILRHDLEKKLDNTSLAHQQERILSKKLQQKLENTTILLTSTAQRLQEEIKLRKSLEENVVNVTNSATNEPCHAQQPSNCHDVTKSQYHKSDSWCKTVSELLEPQYN